MALLVFAAMTGLSARFMTVNAVAFPNISQSPVQPALKPETTDGVYDGTLMKMTDMSYADMGMDVGKTFKMMIADDSVPTPITSQIHTVNQLYWHVAPSTASEQYFSDLQDWKVIKVENKELSQGFYAIAFQRGNTVVIAYRGTDNLQDVLSDASIYLKLKDEVAQRSLALEFAADVRSSLPSGAYNVIFTGHSIAGWLAQQAYRSLSQTQSSSGWQSCYATVFNSIGTEFKSTPVGKTKVTDYHVRGDVFSDFGTSLGQMIVVPVPKPGESIYDKHQMLNFYPYFYGAVQ